MAINFKPRPRSRRPRFGGGGSPSKRSRGGSMSRLPKKQKDYVSRLPRPTKTEAVSMDQEPKTAPQAAPQPKPQAAPQPKPTATKAPSMMQVKSVSDPLPDPFVDAKEVYEGLQDPVDEITKNYVEFNQTPITPGADTPQPDFITQEYLMGRTPATPGADAPLPEGDDVTLKYMRNEEIETPGIDSPLPKEPMSQTFKGQGMGGATELPPRSFFNLDDANQLAKYLANLRQMFGSKMIEAALRQQD